MPRPTTGQVRSRIRAESGGGAAYVSSNGVGVYQENGGVERPIDFSRDRDMLCASCGYRFRVDLDWLDRWNCGQEDCPGCGLTCEREEAPQVTVDPDDPALHDGQVARFSWYHTSTHADWPKKDFDPAAALTEQTRWMMGGDTHVTAWATRQKAKALHVGTYEAAIHNMLRRMDDQADRLSQFYLYRVHLRPDVVVREGWLIDPSNFVGDVVLAEVCPPGIDVVRYLNYHEDPGGLSLALGRAAIQWIQRVALPLPMARQLDAPRSRETREHFGCPRSSKRQAGPFHETLVAAGGRCPRGRYLPIRSAAR